MHVVGALYTAAGSPDWAGVLEVNTQAPTVWGETEGVQPWVNTHLWHDVLHAFHSLLLVASPKAYPHLITENQDPHHTFFSGPH